VQRVLRGTYVRAGVALDVRVRTLAALRLAPPGSVAARATAAVLLGGVVPHGPGVHLRVPSGQRRRPAVDARVRRYDLSWPELRLAVEYDGRQHAQSQRQWERDVERREELDLDGWLVLSKGVYREPERTLDRVVAALRARGVRARVTSDEWRLLFPGRDRGRVAPERARIAPRGLGSGRMEPEAAVLASCRVQARI
jgi:hypothetical protein